MVAVGIPLDYIKVVIQTTAQKPSSELSIMKDIYQKHRFKGFYRGSSSMFFDFSVTGGIQFLTYEWAKKQLHRLGGRKGEYDQMDLSLKEVGLAGAICGWAAAFIYCPT